MKMNSYLIFGITGSIGNSFAKLLSNKNSKIHITGYFNSSTNINDIKSLLDNVTLNLYKIDLTSKNSILSTHIPNYEGLLYVAGQAHFSNDFFDFSPETLYSLINIDIISLLLIIKRLRDYNPRNLKKIVIVNSKIPDTIKSIYHMSKYLQTDMLNQIKDILNKENIGLSLIHTGWVNTNMMEKYMSFYHHTPNNYIEPEFLSEIIYEEFCCDKLFNNRFL